MQSIDCISTLALVHLPAGAQISSRSTFFWSSASHSRKDTVMKSMRTAGAAMHDFGMHLQLFWTWSAGAYVPTREDDGVRGAKYRIPSSWPPLREAMCFELRLPVEARSRHSMKRDRSLARRRRAHTTGHYLSLTRVATKQPVRHCGCMLPSNISTCRFSRTFNAIWKRQTYNKVPDGTRF